MNDRSNLHVLEPYHYPAEVIEVLETILDKLDPLSVESLLLHGSTSRGELSYFREDNDFLWLSDLEFHVILKDRAKRRFRNEFSRDMAQLEKKINSSSPLFHIDFSYKTKTQLRHLPPTFLTYDKKVTGLSIYGDDCRPLIPEVTVQRLDFKELNQVVFWRLWAIFLHLPFELLRNTTKKSVGKTFQYVLYRQVLDITTWLLPREGHLIPTFQTRVEFLERNFSTMESRHYFDSGFLAFLREALTAKQTAVMERDVEDIYRLALGYLMQSLCCLHEIKEQSASTRSLMAAISNVEANHFDPVSLKRLLWDGLFIYKHKGLKHPFRALRWIAQKKFRNASIVMLSFLESIRARMFHDTKEADDLLLFACEIYNQLNPYSPLPDSLPSDFAQRAAVLHGHFIHFMEDFIKGVGEKRAYITNVQRYLGNDCFSGLEGKGHD